VSTKSQVEQKLVQERGQGTESMFQDKWRHDNHSDKAKNVAEVDELSSKMQEWQVL
jgi:hypothetical protein